MKTDRVKLILNKALSLPMIKRKYPFIEDIFVTNVEERKTKPGNYIVKFDLYYRGNYSYKDRNKLIGDLYNLLDVLGIGEGEHINHVYLNDNKLNQ